MVDGHTATIACAGGAAMQTPTPTTVSIDWKASQFAAAAAAGAGASGTLLDSALYVLGAQGYPKYGTQFPGHSILTMDLGAASSDVAQSVSFANPLAANYGTTIQPASRYAVPVTAAPTTVCTSPKAGTLEIANFLWEDVSYLSSTLVPLVQPVAGAHSVVGSTVSDPVFGTGKPVTVSWTAPATGNTPTAYRIFLYSVDPTPSCNSGAGLRSAFWVFGSATSAVISPRMIRTNDGAHQYAVVVRSYWWDNTTDPTKVGNIFGGTRRGAAEAFGGTFLH
jgi:hypothetical protein